MDIRDFAARWAMHYINPDFLKIPTGLADSSGSYYYPAAFGFSNTEEIESKLTYPQYFNGSLTFYLYILDENNNKKYLKHTKTVQNEELNLLEYTFKYSEDNAKISTSVNISLNKEKYIFIINKNKKQSVYIEEEFCVLGKIFINDIPLEDDYFVSKNSFDYNNIVYDEINHEAAYLKVKIANKYFDVEEPQPTLTSTKISSSTSSDWYIPGSVSRTTINDISATNNSYFSYLPDINDNNIDTTFNITAEVTMATEEKAEESYSFIESDTVTMGWDSLDHNIGWDPGGWTGNYYERPHNTGWSRGALYSEKGQFGQEAVCHITSVTTTNIYNTYFPSSITFYCDGETFLTERGDFLEYKNWTIQSSGYEYKATEALPIGSYSYPNDGAGTYIPPSVDGAVRGPYRAKSDEVFGHKLTHRHEVWMPSKKQIITNYDGTIVQIETDNYQIRKAKEDYKMSLLSYDWFHKGAIYWTVEEWDEHIDSVETGSVTRSGNWETIFERRGENTQFTSSVGFSNIIDKFRKGLASYLQSKTILKEQIKYINFKYIMQKDNENNKNAYYFIFCDSQRTEEEQGE